MPNQNDYFNSLLPTHEVGSMRKLNATILALQGRTIPKIHLEEIRYWWSKLNLDDPEEFISLLLNRPDEKSVDFQHWQLNILKSRLMFNIRFLEDIGLDFVYTKRLTRRL